MQTIDTVVSFVVVTCSACGCSFGLTAMHQRQLRDTHATFHCPNGHSQYWPAQSDAEKLRDDLARVTEQRDRARANREEEQRAHRATERRLIATKGVVTRTRNRIAHGVCPCCKRSFAALSRHMKTQHPEYAETPA